MNPHLKPLWKYYRMGSVGPTHDVAVGGNDEDQNSLTT